MINNSLDKFKFFTLKTEYMENTLNQALINDISILWANKNYDEASVLILNANHSEILLIIQDILLNYLSGEALTHILHTLTLAEWDLCQGLVINKSNQTIILPILALKYQSEFDLADFSDRIKMFSEMSADYIRNQDQFVKEIVMNFLQKNWPLLVKQISNLNNGLKVYRTLKNPKSNNIWSTVALLKTIKEACKNTSILETEKIYHLLKAEIDNDCREPLQILIAQELLQKIE